MQLEELREQMIAQGQNCSEVTEIEPGLYEIKVGKRDAEDADEKGELACQIESLLTERED